MKIDYISSDGIHRAEKDALEKMRVAFNLSPFSNSWHGYAGFELIDRAQGDREIDLILVTHDRILLLELKNWHGVITPMNDHWLLNRNDMGRSPVNMTSLKLKILNGKMKNRLSEPIRSVRNDYRVILCGQEDIRALPEEQRGYIVKLDDFLKIATEGNYTKMFGPKKPINGLDHLTTLNAFFRGPEFKPTIFSFNNFQIDGDAIFAHPDGLYREYRALKQDDIRLQALLRRWDFSSLAGVADTKDERSKIALREQRVLSFIHEHNEDLYGSLFQPLAFPTRDSVDADFCELYRLPSRQSRLSGFINKYRDVLSTEDRIGLVKIFVSQFADLHDLGVAHRDIGDHTIWLERPSKVSISGFVAAHFPEVGTVGGLQTLIRAGSTVLPEDSEALGQGTPTDAFRRDVFLLGVAAHQLLFLKSPQISEGSEIPVWEPVANDPYIGRFNGWLEKAMDIVPSDRYANAREMLDALNILKPAQANLEFDARDFAAFESDVLPTVAYPIEANLKQGRTHVYQSSFGDQKLCVKIWYGLRPDTKRPGESHRLLDFLNHTRLVKAQPCESIPAIIDFGLSQLGTYAVTEWVEGSPLGLIKPTSLTEALLLCKSLIDAVVQLHALQLAHGDLSPENIIVNTGKPHFVDMVDFFPEGVDQPHNLAYGPVESEGATAQERDCYAIAKICSEILIGCSAGPVAELAQIFDELARCLARDLNVYRLDRIQEEIDKTLAPPSPAAQPIVVKQRRATVAVEIPSDNGCYHIGVFADAKQNTNVMFSLTGVRTQILLSVDKQTRQVSWLRASEIPHSQFVRQANRALAQLTATITLQPGHSDDGQALVSAVLSIPSAQDAFEELLGSSSTVDQDTTLAESSTASPTTKELWRSIIRAEESTLPEVEITGRCKWDFESLNRIQVPYSKEGQPLDYDSDDQIKIVQEIDGEYVQLGELNTKDTSPNILVIDRVDKRFRQQIGEKIKLQSTRDRASFQKRRSATLRIADEQAVIPHLLDYFDPAMSPKPERFDGGPTEEDFKVYDLYKDGDLVFSLNPQQRDAFKMLWSSGPLSLLQGPPGTGKTAFIASFIHYALSHGAGQILLASQSHEGVNNAAEKVLELSERTAARVGLVRFGAEGMVSDPLRPFHVNAILHEYRELFRAEMRERLVSFAPNLGLSRDYVREWWGIQVNLGALWKDIARLHQRIELVKEGTSPLMIEEWKRKIGKRTERFDYVALNQFGMTGATPRETLDTLELDLAKRHGVDSPDAVAKLRRLEVISQEWIDRLATLRGNFEEFLAKTRNLVCGTCVGLGRAEFGIVTNKYDWVIIDEAARATPGELAVAMQTGRRVLLVGDHRQLPPLYTKEVLDHISNEFPGASRETLSRSDFERAFESDYGKAVGITLQTQYRMAPSIGELVSSCFYPSPLAAGRGPAKAFYSDLPLGAKSTITWIDTSKAGTVAHDRPKPNHGFDNLYECRVVLALLKSIQTDASTLSKICGDVSGEDKPIGIICAYREQANLLQRLLSEQEWAVGLNDLIKVDTVDSYQGKENRIIILSLTRNNPGCVQGFLKSPERINVSISRAMERLVIVGATRMWSGVNTVSPLAKVLSFIQARQASADYSLVESLEMVGAGRKL
jgi:serine/threonine protein kinase